MQIDGMHQTMLAALFETVPLEITVIDANDKVIGWNKHNTRLFYRPEACFGMDFRECHPEKSLSLVEEIVRDMRGGKRDTVRFWADFTVDREKGTRHKVLIDFFALRDPQGNYLGCMECAQDVEEIMHLEGEKRLME